MKRVRLCIVVTAMMLAYPVGAWAIKEPTGFRGVPWGATENQLQTALKIAPGSCMPGDLGTRQCTGDFLLADTPMRVTYVFRGNRFVKVAMTFPAQDFDKIAAVFQERYGQLLWVDESRTMLFGEGPTVVIYLKPYAGNGTRKSVATIQTQQEYREAHRLYREQLKKAGKEL
jgi:hypothetical protein